jgi:hypothetical protein
MSELLEPKSGLQSSEFWSLQASKVVALLVAFGLLTQDQGDAVVAAISHAAAAIVLIVGLVWGDIRYSADRTALKTFLADLDPDAPPDEFPPDDDDDDDDDEFVVTTPSTPPPPPPPSPADKYKVSFSPN